MSNGMQAMPRGRARPEREDKPRLNSHSAKLPRLGRMAEVAPAAPKPEEAEKKEEVKKADKKFEFDRPRHIRFLKHCLNVLPSPYLTRVALFHNRSFFGPLNAPQRCARYIGASAPPCSYLLFASHLHLLCSDVRLLDSFVDTSLRRVPSSPSSTSSSGVRHHS